MQTISTIKEISAVSAGWARAEKRIALVPTMGCLHAGHLSLMQLARAAADKVIVTIYVNPTQFGPNEDFQKYPRALNRDCRFCEDAGVDAVFHPTPANVMYTTDHSVWINEDTLATGLCGASRPGHFRGVLTIVAKLFNLIRPDVAVFGQKDAQQDRLIRRMVRDLNFPIQLITAPIIREPDGLAMSSRNTYLSSAERRDALCLMRALQLARRLFHTGERDAACIRTAAVAHIQKTPSAIVDYAAIVDDTTLSSVTKIQAPVLLALAVRIGKTRLIDNLTLPDNRLCNLPEFSA